MSHYTESDGTKLQVTERQWEEHAVITSSIRRAKNVVCRHRAFKAARLSWKRAKKAGQNMDLPLQWCNSDLEWSRRSRDVCKIDLLSCVSKRIKLSWQQLLFPRMRIKADSFSCTIEDLRLSYPHNPVDAILCKWSETCRHPHFSSTCLCSTRFLLASSTAQVSFLTQFCNTKSRRRKNGECREKKRSPSACGPASAAEMNQRGKQGGWAAIGPEPWECL